MICLDTNILIYVIQGRLDESIVADELTGVASVVWVEALGFSKITVGDERRIRGYLETLTKLPLEDEVIERAIGLRQDQRMSLGDAIIAATALTHDAVLWTANTRDFAGIDGLRLHDPLST